MRPQIAVIGHSHINCIERAYERVRGDIPFAASFIRLKEKKYNKDNRFETVDLLAVQRPVAERDAWSDFPLTGLRICGTTTPIAPFRTDTWRLDGVTRNNGVGICQGK